MSHLILKGSTWHVRMEVPKDVRHAFQGKRNVFKSLKTGSKSKAQKMKWEILFEWKNKIDIARNGVKDYEVEGQIIFMNTVKKGFEKVNKKKIIDYINNNNTINVEYFNETYEGIIECLSSYNDDKLKDEHLSKINNIRDIIYKSSGKIDIILLKEYLNLTDEIYNTSFLYEMKAEGFTDEQIKKAVSTDIELEVEHPFSDSNLKKFYNYQKNKKGIIDKSNDSMISKLKKMRSFFVDNNLEVTFNNVDKFFDDMNRSVKTKQTYRHAGSSFFKWLKKYSNDYLFKNKENPFLGHEFLKEKDKENRVEFTVNDIKKLYEEAIKINNQNLANVIKIGAYSGCRIEEICQLKKDDIVIKDNIRCIYIRKGKTKSATRYIPINSSIIKLIDELCKNTDENNYLLNIGRGNKYGIRSDSISKAFGRLKKSLNYDQRYVFHSIRRTFVTQLERNSVDTRVIMALTGHLTNNFTLDVYSGRSSEEQKLEAIKTLKFDI